MCIRDSLSDSLDYLNKLSNNKSEFNKVLKSAKNPLIILGTSAINNDHGKKILETAGLIAKKIQKNKNINPLNILNQDISRVGALDLKFYNKKFTKKQIDT